VVVCVSVGGALWILKRAGRGGGALLLYRVLEFFGSWRFIIDSEFCKSWSSVEAVAAGVSVLVCSVQCGGRLGLGPSAFGVG